MRVLSYFLSIFDLDFQKIRVVNYSFIFKDCVEGRKKNYMFTKSPRYSQEPATIFKSNTKNRVLLSFCNLLRLNPDRMQTMEQKKEVPQNTYEQFGINLNKWLY